MLNCQNCDKFIMRAITRKTDWRVEEYRYYICGQTRTVDVHIAHLRKILAGSRVSIETVTGVGYMLVAG